MKAAKWLFMKHAPLIVRPTLDPVTWRWMLQMLANCTSARYAVNKGRMVRIAEYSRDVLMQLRADTGIRYDERMQGTLEVFRSQKQLDGIAKDIAVLKADGVPFEVLDREGCVQVEPGLKPAAHKIVGGLRLPGDETGDCFLFTNALAKLAEGLGVRFVYNVDLKRLRRDGDRIAAVETAQGDYIADSYVAALGSYMPGFLAPLGLDLPIYPVKGYSITVPILDEAKAPVSTVMDEYYKIAITRLARASASAAWRRSPASTRICRPPARRRSPSRGRPVRRRRRPEEGGVLVRPAPHDAGWHAHHRQDEVRQPVPERWPRHARLDHVLRVRPSPVRHHLRCQARNLHRRAGSLPLSLSRRPGAFSARRGLA